MTRKDVTSGSPYNATTYDQSDFRDSYLTIGKQKFALFYADSVYGSCGYTLAFSSYNGKPTSSYLDGTIERVTDQGLILVSAVGQEDYAVYVAQKGEIVRAKRFDY